MRIRVACSLTVAAAVASVSLTAPAAAAAPASDVPLALSAFFAADADALTLDKVREAIDASDRYFSTGDGVGTATTDYGSNFGWAHHWVTADSVTYLDAYDGGKQTLYTPTGSYVSVAAAGTAWSLTPTRDMYAIPRSSTIEWAAESQWMTDCEIFCSDISNEFPYMTSDPKADPTITRTTTGAGDVTVTVTIAKNTGGQPVTLTLTGNTSTGTFSYTMVRPDETNTVTVQMGAPADADIPQMVKDGHPNLEVTASLDQYEAAYLISSAKDVYFAGAVKKNPRYNWTPTAKDMQKVTGKTLKNGYMTFKVAKSAKPKTGPWKVTVTSKYGSANADFWYTPKKRGSNATYVAVGY